MKNILGLDLGTNSIGWALIQKNDSVDSGYIVAANSRIIPMSQDILGKFDSGVTVSQTAERTHLRGIRRLRERQLLRRERLHRVLNIIDFLPPHYSFKIDFEDRLGQFFPEEEPKLAWRLNMETAKPEFLFKTSFEEMVSEFRQKQPELVHGDLKIPYDWTIYYLRKKALSQKILKEELAWLLLNFNQKRGYNQLRGEEEEEAQDKKVEFYALKVLKVEDSGDRKKDEVWYNVHLENGWIYRRTSKTMLDWVGKTKEFIVTTDLNEDGTEKTDKEGNVKRSFRAPAENDWTLVKKKTEFDIEKSGKTVGEYIFDALLENPKQKIKGQLVRVVERKYYKAELLQILECQQKFHPELQDLKLYQASLEELYPNNEAHRNNIGKKDFTYLFLNDILFYQRPLKSKKSLISNCKFESRQYMRDGILQSEGLKAAARSHPLFQEFRLLQFLQNLRIYRKDGHDIDVTNEILKTTEEWENLLEWLNTRKEIDQKALLNHLGLKAKKNTPEYRWNYVEDKSYPANETRSLILNKLAKVENVPANFLTQETEEAIWHLLYSVEDKEAIKSALDKFAQRHGLGEDFVEQFRKLPPFKKEYAAYSVKALKKVLPLMRFGKFRNENAIDQATKTRIEKIITGEFDHEMRDRVRQKSMHLTQISDFQNLPQWLVSYIVYDRHSEDGEAKKWKSPEDIEPLPLHSLRNPIVEQIINETLKTVRAIWLQYGQGKEDFFDEIHIELGREMKNTAAQRKDMTTRNIQNENTNLRIKALLSELHQDGNFENVRPFSPMQHEILKIYEEGALNMAEVVPDDIVKISKTGVPSQSELTRYKLWLQQKYRSPYTGEIIPLGKLFTRAYDIEHIIPQSRYFDDALSNKIICETAVNQDKGNKTAYEYILDCGGKIIDTGFGKTVQIHKKEAYEATVKLHFSNSPAKLKKLLMEDIPEAFVQRQLNDTRYISKVVKSLLSNIVREPGEQEAISKNVLVSSGQITDKLKQDWGLNHIWNELITPRFERLNELTKSNAYGEWTEKEGKKVFQTTVPPENLKGFSKKRIDHRHHALDAIVIATATRNHINYLNNEHALGKGTPEEKSKKRYDLRGKLCEKKYTDTANYKWTFKKPWGSFTQETRTVLSKAVVSFKQNLRVLNKTVNKPLKWQTNTDGNLEKMPVKQTKGENWAIRKPLHKDTISGLVKLRNRKMVNLAAALDNWSEITDKELRLQIKELVKHHYDKKMLQKFFKDRQNKWQGRDISKVEIFYWVDDLVASRVKIDESFDAKKIESITDTGIRKIMLNHLENYQEEKNGKLIARPDLAFSADGLEEMNWNIKALNGGKNHQPIFKVRTFEPKGNKFAVGQTGNKTAKYVEAAKGTNLFFAVYQSEKGKRSYETIPLNLVIERQKQKLTPVPEKNEAGNELLFYLSPNDLVYVPSEDESNNRALVDFRDLSPEQVNRVYKIVSFTGGRLYAIQNSIAKAIIDKFEFTQLNKLEFTPEKQSIKEVCWKLQSDHLGNLKLANIPIQNAMIFD